MPAVALAATVPAIILSALGPVRSLIAASWRRAAAFAAHLLIALGHGCFAGQSNAALLIDAQAFDPDFIAHFDDILGLLDAEVRQFADVNQTIFTRQEFDEGAEILNGNDAATINL